jgi:hypothetical protein
MKGRKAPPLRSDFKENKAHECRFKSRRGVQGRFCDALVQRIHLTIAACVFFTASALALPAIHTQVPHSLARKNKLLGLSFSHFNGHNSEVARHMPELL